MLSRQQYTEIPDRKLINRYESWSYCYLKVSTIQENHCDDSFSILYLKTGYCQVEIEGEYRPMANFTTPHEI